MAATLKSLTSKRATVHVPIDPDEPDGEKVTVVYKPKAYTRPFEKELNKITQGKGEDEAIGAAVTTRAFVNIVAEWDLKADATDSEPIPITEDGLDDVPVAFLAEVLTAIGDDQNPDPTTGNASRKRS